MRIGFGFDVHQLETGRPFFIGGIKIDHHKGAVGHSDADVMIHAICDALLGAACLGDIGKHFPDTSSEFKNIDSKILLQHTCVLIAGENYKIGNIDVTLCLQEPKISGYIPEMKKAMCEIMNLELNCLSIKATTTEKLGYVGRKEGVSCYAVALLLNQNE
ncbi:MAG: 2-C-methyl-D-erythritol 2,4-cyclodiphosphate synthase [Bacteroidetes bacterium]|nr:MAG: 2-C-methyl-D-erythritol 2,4-cyclodiphosphate synthase [Bacteroidota bacterium]REK05295.1 MAG: 2-C-methyl-D-erythritol 2,4-cyclodiphosphate synthase [Bacteroidota bacterium]REK32700.1 MAG: 2-C-methyl-D-erythritol 2,4-cyclodiphosphate synthase [Bacteroidota bacterium]REK48853.1 MAG: 2-C-methyl-D-erythritol 2,4-cyclodiphosphate synthase [Bacteroidota bacterium]